MSGNFVIWAGCGCVCVPSMRASHFPNPCAHVGKYTCRVRAAASKNLCWTPYSRISAQTARAQIGRTGAPRSRPRARGARGARGSRRGHNVRLPPIPPRMSLRS
eukprot:3730842-Prymnesium_polylepis.1